MVHFKLLRRAFLLVLSLLVVAPLSANALEFSVLKDDRGRNVLFMYGSIERDDVEKFQSALLRTNNLRGFWLSSGGGYVDVSYRLGRMIRESRLPVTVPSLTRMEAAIARSPSVGNGAQAHLQRLQAGRPTNICASACGMLLAGGVVRFVDEATTVGLHSASALGGEYTTKSVDRDEAQLIERRNQSVGIRWSAYMQEMGINLNYVAVASRVPARCMYWLSERDLDTLNIVNVRGGKPTGSTSGICTCTGETREESRTWQQKCLADVTGN